MADTRNAREMTSLYPDEALVLAELAELAGLNRSELVRLLVLDGLRRYAAGGRLRGVVEREARAARVRLEGIRAEVEAEPVSRERLAAY